MKQILYGLAIVTTLVACNKSESKTNVEVPQLETSTPSAIEAASAIGAQSSPTTYTTPQAQPAPAAGVKLNPAHGEPGHICEIAVGAPLPADGVVPAAQPTVAAAPAKPMPINPSTTSTLNMPINTVVPTGPKPKFNPAHGQPWHDCDLDVGAPLN